LRPSGARRSAGGADIARRAMIVLDAAVVVELLTNGPIGDSLRRDLAGRDDTMLVRICWILRW